MNAIEVKKLSKSYGKKRVLDNITFEIPQGQICALVGRNGMGKTTLINALLDLIPHEVEGISFFGQSRQDNEIGIKRKIGCMLEDKTLIPELSVRNYLEFVGSLYKVSTKQIKIRVEQLSESFFSDFSFLDVPLHQCSSGMKRLTAFAASVIHEPDLLILDEPFSNLDIVNCKKIADFLLEHKGAGKTVFFSDHNLLYVNRLSDRFWLLKDGQILNISDLGFSSDSSDNLLEHIEKLLQP
jgi:ABC-2 type transport system ATP-binding protein